MKAVYSISVFVFLAIFSSNLTNIKLISKIKRSVTITQLEILELESENLIHPEPNKILFKNLLITDTAFEKNIESCFTFIEKGQTLNPTLNLLYLGHSPPQLS